MRDGRDGRDGKPGARGEQGPEGPPGRDGSKGDRGEPGPRGERGADGATGATGATGLRGDVGPRGEPGANGKDGRAGGPGKDGARGPAGKVGPAGDRGWSPILAVEADGERRVHRVTAWTGGTGDPPESGWYVGPDGPVRTAGEATDLRGARGRDGFGGVVVQGGEESVQREVFVTDSAPVVTYPAINFATVSGSLKRMQVNV